jgi:flagellar hook protein FlgE
MPLFSIPLSGLTASSDALNVISNNIANLNTTGFKGQQASFQDLFYQSLGTTGAGDPVQMGAGTQVGSIDTNFSNGNLQSTGVPSNVAISGNGLFVTENASGGVSYTRAGDFGVNANGELVTSGGDAVLGYPAVDGAISQGQGLSALQLGQGQSSSPVATTTIQQQTNLDASAAVGTQYSTTQAVYDSLGNSHTLTFNFTKSATDTWTYQVTLPAADTGGTGNPTVVGAGTMDFNANGDLTTPAGAITGLAITGLADGAGPINMTWNPYGTAGAGPLITQVAAQSSTTTTNQNGYASGTLQSYNINADGTISGSFSNGQVQTIGQIALASFANMQGLALAGGNSYTPTLASGQAVIGAPEAGGRGSLTGGSLELSNVDISTEFTNLIVVQRGFEANARMVTTFDSVSQDTINLQASPGN